MTLCLLNLKKLKPSRRKSKSVQIVDPSQFLKNYISLILHSIFRFKFYTCMKLKMQQSVKSLMGHLQTKLFLLFNDQSVESIRKLGLWYFTVETLQHTRFKFTSLHVSVAKVLLLPTPCFSFQTYQTSCFLRIFSKFCFLSPLP